MRFEKVKRFENNAEISLPVRATKNSAGYDFAAAENILVPSIVTCQDVINQYLLPKAEGIFTDLFFSDKPYQPLTYTLDKVKDITKATKSKPTLIPTGIKCKLDPNTYLELSVRSSTPLKYWLVLANGVGIIDADYYSNPDNDGEIFFQLINLSPVDILIQKGEVIGQGIIKNFLITEDDAAAGERAGGFGSTSNE